jgi:nicotinamidase-related amidase
MTMNGGNVTDDPKILLVVDMQQGFVDSPDTRAIVPNVVEMTKLWQDRGWPIVCSRFVNLPGSNWHRLRDWHDLQNEPATLLIPELDGVTQYILKKSTYSAWSDEVSMVCAAHQARDVVIVGVDTNECVLATALSVFDSGLTPWIVRDACASSGGSKPHNMALELLAALMGQQQVIGITNLR